MNENGVWINVDSQAPNTIVYEALIQDPSIIGIQEDFRELQQEVTYDQSRFDIYYETVRSVKWFIEIKVLTLENNQQAMFPGAPTTRGVKHLQQLVQARKDGYQSHIFYCVQIPYITSLSFMKKWILLI